jgi:hypothetical protein
LIDISQNARVFVRQMALLIYGDLPYTDGANMDTYSMNSNRNVSRFNQEDHEAILLTSLHNAFCENGVSLDPADITNFYVALKSKPLAILAGPAHSGKTALVRGLAQSLSDQDKISIQMITGHPWWAEGSDDVARNTELHIRYSTEKIMSIIEEAGQPYNTHQVFIACLTQISPAELLSFFTEVSYQLQNGQIMRLGDTHLTEPVGFPSNLRIIGTMDTNSFDWWDDDLLYSTTVIQWSQESDIPDPVINQERILGELEFLQSCIRGKDAAYSKVYPVLKHQRQPLYTLLQVKANLHHYVSCLDLALDEVIIYLANSWSRLGDGLFHPSPDRNLAIALDLAITQILLPRAVEAIRNEESLRDRLIGILTDKYPHSTGFMTIQGNQV